MSGDLWQEEELKRFMAEHADDPMGEHLPVRLSNPDEEREIDEMILQELRPGVVQALRGSRLTTGTGGNNTPAEGLETFTTNTSRGPSRSSSRTRHARSCRG